MTTFGVVIPTHQGSTRLDRSMISLAGQTFTGELRVVVAVNDGRPDSLERAHKLAPVVRAAGASCTVIRTAPGRSAAIRAAEHLLPPSARLYLDQDALLSPNAIASLAGALAPGTGWHFAAPALRLAPMFSAVSQRYYQFWRELPYVRGSPVTCGAYAISESGRARWDELPCLHSDDKWARWHFAPEERSVVRAASYEVLVPDGLAELVRARHRYNHGNRELAGIQPAPPHSDERERYRGVLRALVTRPAHWRAAAVFFAVHSAVAVRRDRPGAVGPC